MDYLQREWAAAEAVDMEEKKPTKTRTVNEKKRKARDSKDYEAMLLDLVRDEVKGL